MTKTEPAWELLQFTDVVLEGDHRLYLQLFLWLSLTIIYVFIWLVLCGAGDGMEELFASQASVCTVSTSPFCNSFVP